MRYLLVVLALVACNENPKWRTDNAGHEIVWQQLPITWSSWPIPVPPEFRAGFEYWDGLLDGGVFREVECGDFPCAQVTVAPQPLDYDGGNAWARTYVQVDAGFMTSVQVVYFDVFFDADSSPRESIGRHEVGHVLGLMHSERARCLMYMQVDSADRVTKDVCAAELKMTKEHYGR